MDLSGLTCGNIIISFQVRPNRKWVRVLKDIDGNMVNIFHLKVERNLPSGNTWILCLHNKHPDKRKHVFHLDFEKTKVRSKASIPVEF